MTKNRKPSITIRFGALHNSLTVNGTTIDMNGLNRKERNQASSMVIGSLATAGYFPKTGG